MKKYTKITKEIIDKVLELNKKGFSYKEIKKELQLESIRGVQYYIQKNNIAFLNNHKNIKKYQTYSNYFNIIDKYEKAYILGFTYADGCIYDHKRFGYCISIQDQEIIEFIKSEISPNRPIKYSHNTKGANNRQPQVVFRISDINLIKDLNRFGLIQNKTINTQLVFPDLSEELTWAFIRGLFDGDGCISTKTKTSLQMVLCLTDLNFLEKLKNFLEKRNIYSVIREKKGKTCNYYLLAIWRTKEAAKFFNKIYNNSEFSLSRKKKKYLTYKENTEVTSGITKGSEAP